MRKKIIQWIGVFVVIILISGCFNIGPHEISATRNRFNDIIQNTDDEQLLENIVRLHYLYPATFLKVSSVTDSHTATSSVSPSFSYTDFLSAISSITKNASAQGFLSYSDVPTIIYTPIENAEFATALLTPVKLRDVYLLTLSGPQTFLHNMQLFVQSVNDINNAEVTTGAKIDAVPEYRDFYQLLDQLQYISIHYKNGLTFIPCRLGDTQQFCITMHFSKAAARSAQAIKFKKMLDIPQNKQDIVVAEPSLKPEKVDIIIRMRSILGILTYLSHSVETPEADIKNGYVLRTAYPDGRPFHWQTLLNGIMHIYYSNSTPPDAFVVAYFHGHWFYIKDSDIDSKATFNLVTQLLSITAGQTEVAQLPSITLPSPGL